MSRQKLFNMIKSRGTADVGRNSFDLTNRHVYTQKAAKITPVKALHTNPKDFFNISMAEFSQNNVPMHTAAFLNGIKELSAYFIPFNTIWHNFNQFMATREDPDSVVLQEKGISYCPRVSLLTLYAAGCSLWLLKMQREYYIKFDAFKQFVTDTYAVEPLGDDTTPFITYFQNEVGEYATFEQYIDFQRDYFEKHKNDTSEGTYQFTATFDTYLKSVVETWDETPFVNTSTIYNVPCFDFTCYETANSLDDAPTNYEMATDIFGNFRWCDWLQKLDMLGYGNIYPTLYIATNKYIDIFDRYFTDASNKISGYTFPQVVDLNKSWCHDDLESYVYDFINEEILLASRSGESPDYTYSMVNPFALFAYNKIFYDMFRNTYYDNKYSVRNYNVDYLDCNTLAGSVIQGGDLPYRFFSIECHQWKKDMFTGVLPDNQLGDVSSLILSSGILRGDVSISADTDSAVYLEEASKLKKPNGSDLGINSSANLQVTPDNSDNLLFATGIYGRIETPHVHPFNDVASIQLSGSDISLNVLALKRAEAIQQYRQDLMRAGNRTRDIFQTIFGANPKSEMDESPYFVDAKNNPINVNPIIATANTESGNNGQLGDIAARVTISGNNLSFKFSTEDFGVLIFLSYIVPESMYNSYRIDPCNALLDQEGFGLPYFQNLGLQPIIGEYLNNMRNASYRNMTLGFAPPYLEKKTDIDLVHGNLVDASFNDDDSYQGSLSHWVVARTDMQNSDAVTLRNFYIDPRILDNVFQFNAGDDYESDHFITFCEIKVDAVRAFSEVGLPRFV